jgi:hypothetical protein
MSIEEHLSTLYGLPVVGFPARSRAHEPLPEPDAVAWRLGVEYGYDPATGRVEYEEGFEEIWRRFLATTDPSRVRAVVVGAWDRTAGGALENCRDLLIEAAPRLPALRAVFLADLVREETDIAYIKQCDPQPLLAAFPLLEEFGARGTGTEYGSLSHPALRTVRFESGGLPAEAVRAVAGAELPCLEHLDLWLGVEEYGGTARVEDLAPLLDGRTFPRLRHLMLGDSEIEDDIAAAVASAPVVAGLETLSLAMGILTDQGAEALLSGQPLTHLKRLDLHHHFLSDAMMQRIREALEPAGVEVDLDGQEEAEEWDDGVWRYVAVSE